MNETVTLKTSGRLYVWVPVEDVYGRHTFTIIRRDDGERVQNAAGVFFPVNRG